ncbi:MAG: hypothetical protein KF745_02490 [Phycisphaeraceae bacterium]|nr:hypothetical protein [Phycisphaeraceae bacterium]
MSAVDQNKALSTLLKRLADAHPRPEVVEPVVSLIDPAEPLVEEFVRSFMMWECTSAKAAAAMKRISQGVVDFNELRVCLPDELAAILGERFPRVQERCQRLRAALNAIYLREHAVTLQRLAEAPKREAADYLATLDGVPGYVASRVTLVSLGGHTAPVDERLLGRLIASRVVEEGATVRSAATLLERRIRAGELAEAHRVLQLWSDHDDPVDVAGAASRTRASSKRSNGKVKGPVQKARPPRAAGRAGERGEK